MMRAVTALVGILVVAVVGYCVYYYRVELGLVRPPGSSAAVPSQPTVAGAQPAQPLVGRSAAWQTIDRPADGFQVEMPAGVTEARVPARTTAGGAEPIEMLESSTSPESTFAVSWAENPPVERASRPDPDRTLDLALNGALARTQTVLITQTRTTYSGFAARDFAARGDGGVMTARLILAGNRLFMLVASFPSQSAQHDADVNRFFSSFIITAPSRAN